MHTDTLQGHAARTGLLSLPVSQVNIISEHTAPFQADVFAFGWSLVPTLTGFGINTWVPPVYSAQDIFEIVNQSEIDRQSISARHLGLVCGEDSDQVSEVIRGMKLSRSLGGVWLHTPHGLTQAGLDAVKRLRQELGRNVTVQVGPLWDLDQAELAQQAGAGSIVLDCSDSATSLGSLSVIRQARERMSDTNLVAAGITDINQEHLALAAGADQIMLRKLLWSVTESDMDIHEITTQLDELTVRTRQTSGQQETMSWPKQRIELYKEIDLNDPFFSCTQPTDRRPDDSDDLEPDIQRVVYTGDAQPVIGDRMAACQLYFADLGAADIAVLHHHTTCISRL